jgi:hypothetical protein
LRASLYARLVVLGAACCYLYPLTYLLPVAAWKRGQRFVIFAFSCSVVRFVARFD